MTLLTDLFDDACPPLLALIEQDRMPGTMFVHPDVHASIARLRRREIDDGYPLMILGMELVADEAVPESRFRFEG